MAEKENVEEKQGDKVVGKQEEKVPGKQDENKPKKAAESKFEGTINFIPVIVAAIITSPCFFGIFAFPFISRSRKYDLESKRKQALYALGIAYGFTLLGVITFTIVISYFDVYLKIADVKE